jgi:hypothetical protein
MKLLEIINKEFSEGRSRKEMGAGVEHKVFPSTTDPNIVYKLGTKTSIDSWVNEFRRDPSIFPEVYKRGKTKYKLKEKQNILTKNGYSTFPAGSIIPMDYVEMEKLDTKQVEKEWDELDNAFENIMEIDDWGFLDFLIIYMTNSPQAKANGYDSDKTISKLDTQIKEHFPGLYPVFLRYLKLTDKIKAVTKGVPDLHRYNFGYDKKGNLKCLDF